jgi:hypothetical protein
MLCSGRTSTGQLAVRLTKLALQPRSPSCHDAVEPLRALLERPGRQLAGAPPLPTAAAAVSSPPATS